MGVILDKRLGQISGGGGGGSVASVFGRTGIVTSVAGDYTGSKITETYTPNNYTETSQTVRGHIEGIDIALNGGLKLSQTPLAPAFGIAVADSDTGFMHPVDSSGVTGTKTGLTTSSKYGIIALPIITADTKPIGFYDLKDTFDTGNIHFLPDGGGRINGGQTFSYRIQSGEIIFYPHLADNKWTSSKDEEPEGNIMFINSATIASTTSFFMTPNGVSLWFHNGVDWQLADATVIDNLATICVIGEEDTSTLRIQSQGFRKIPAHGLTIGADYYLQDTPGTIGLTAGTVEQKILKVLDVDTYYIYPLNVINALGGSSAVFSSVFMEKRATFQTGAIQSTGDTGNDWDTLGLKVTFNLLNAQKTVGTAITINADSFTFNKNANFKITFIPTLDGSEFQEIFSQITDGTTVLSASGSHLHAANGVKTVPVMWVVLASENPSGTTYDVRFGGDSATNELNGFQLLIEEMP